MYNPNVRVGNWFEDLKVKTESVKLYLQKRNLNRLYVQQTRELFSNVLHEITLSKIIDYVKFGSRVQLKAPYMPRNAAQDEDNNGVVMSGTINENDVQDIKEFTDGCAVVCSKLLVPCVRNSFLITSSDCHPREDHNLLFGQDFNLQLFPQFTSEPLFIRSVPPVIDGRRGPLEHNPVRISRKRDCYCKWKALPWESNKRFEAEGSPIPINSHLIIQHVMTGKCLTVEDTEWYLTLFGRDCGISVHTYVDVHKQETANCLWQFASDVY